MINKITPSRDITRIHNDAQAWFANHRAKVIAGDDPMQAILDLLTSTTRSRVRCHHPKDTDFPDSPVAPPLPAR